MPLWNTLLWQRRYFLNQCVQLIASLGIRYIGNFYLACSSFLKKGQLSGLGSSLPTLSLIPLLLQWQLCFVSAGGRFLPSAAVSGGCVDQPLCGGSRDPGLLSGGRRGLKPALALWLLRSDLLALPLVRYWALNDEKYRKLLISSRYKGVHLS